MSDMEKYELKRTLSNDVEVVERMELYSLDVSEGIVTGYANGGVVFSYSPGQWDSIRRVDSINEVVKE